MKTWSEEIDRTTQNFIDYFCGLSPKQLNWKPNSNRWSIAQNIDHLILINESYFPIIASIRAGTYKLPYISRFRCVVSFFGNTVLKAVQPDRKKKMKTLPIWEPAKSEIPEGILERFEVHQSELKNQIENSKDLLDRGAIVSSPANKNIVYKLETAFDIIITHEQRHYEQASEVYQLLREEVTACKGI